MTYLEIITISIALLGLVAVVMQIRKSTEATKADFIYRLRDDFYSKKTKFILFFIENDFIEFRGNKEDGKDYESYFVIKKDSINLLNENFSAFIEFAKKSFYTIHIQEMDDYVLGYLNDIGEYYKNGIIDIDYIFNSFGYYLVNVSQNTAIKEYIEWDRNPNKQRDQYNLCVNDYKLFEVIADKCKSKNQ